MSGSLQRRKKSKRKWKRLWFLLKDKVLYTFTAREVRGHRVSHTSPKTLAHIHGPAALCTCLSFFLAKAAQSFLSPFSTCLYPTIRGTLCALSVASECSSSGSMTILFFKCSCFHTDWCFQLVRMSDVLTLVISGQGGLRESTSAGLHRQADREARGRGKQQRVSSLPQENPLLHLQGR